MTEPAAREHEQRCRPGAETGDPAAMAGLGWALLQQGREAEAELWYAKAAHAGERSGMTGLGYLLDRRGAKDEARAWWQRAAAAGDATAMNNLAYSFRRDNPGEAERWSWHAAAAQRDPRADPVPAEVIDVAAAAGLRTHRSTFGHANKASDAQSMMASLFVAAGPAGLGLFLSWIGLPTILMTVGFVVAAVVVLFAVVGCITTRGDVPERIWVFERGLVYRDRHGQLSTFPWMEIRVLRDITRHYQNYSYKGTSYRYTILDSNGAKLVLSGLTFPMADVCVLGETVERAIAAVRVPRALAALQEGKRLDFGDLSVDTAGISCGQSTLPWSEVEAVDTVEGTVRIKRAGAWLSWSKTYVSSIPDVMVLLIMADALHHAASPRG